MQLFHLLSNESHKIFIAHASEDKAYPVRPLANALKEHPGIEVWYDEFSLLLGDSLLESISKGLRECDFGIVVFSPNLFLKQWPREELGGLFARETIEKRLILPIWHNISKEEILAHYPPLADRYASKSSDGIGTIVSEIFRVIQAVHRTQQITNPIFNRLDVLAKKVAIRRRSDNLRESKEGAAAALAEVHRLFGLFELYFETHKSKLEVEIVRDESDKSILARYARLVLIDRDKPIGESRRSRITFKCEFLNYSPSNVRDSYLHLSFYEDIFDAAGIFKYEEVTHEWKMTPIFNIIEQVVWTNFGSTTEINSEELLNWTISFFSNRIDKSIDYDNYA